MIAVWTVGATGSGHLANRIEVKYSISKLLQKACNAKIAITLVLHHSVSTRTTASGFPTDVDRYTKYKFAGMGAVDSPCYWLCLDFSRHFYIEVL